MYMYVYIHIYMFVCVCVYPDAENICKTAMACVFQYVAMEMQTNIPSSDRGRHTCSDTS